MITWQGRRVGNGDIYARKADATSFTADSAAQITAVLGSGASGKTSVTTAAGSATGVDDLSFLPAFFAGPVGWWPIDGIIGVAIFIAAIPWRLMLSGRKRRRYAVRIASANSVYA